MDLYFDTYKRESWTRCISEFASNTKVASPGEQIIFHFDGLKIFELKPLHIASLACLIEHFNRLKYSISLDNTDVGKYLFHSLKFREYWAGNRLSLSLMIRMFLIYGILRIARRSFTALG